MSKFHIGDEVYLKGQGVRMTVESLTDKEVLCIWMDEEAHVQRDTFPVECLKKAGR